MIKIEKYNKYGVYAYRNKIDNTIFYVGQQKHSHIHENNEYLRAYDFYQKSRGKKCVEHIKNIGIDNIEVIWLYKTENKNEKIFSKELKFQYLYYEIYKEKFLCSEMLNGKFNPNYGNKWTQEMKDSLGRKRTANGQSKNEKNPMATKVVLISPTGKTYHFTMIKNMQMWISKNITQGINYNLLRNKPLITKNINFIKKEYREAVTNLQGWYYMYEKDYVDKCGETIETHNIVYEEVE